MGRFNNIFPGRIFEPVRPCLRGTRLVIPTRLRINNGMLHEGNPGNSKMKSIARGYVWWPGINEELKERVKQCKQCQL